MLVVLAFTFTSCGGSTALLEASACPIPDLGVTEYIIGTGDALQINVWRSAELSSNVIVRPDGKVTTPLVDDIQASGKTPTQLANDIEQVLGEYLRSPEVSVIVATQGAANQIQVVGEVNQPAPVAYRNGLRVLDVVISAGGLTDFAAGNRSKIVRTISGRSVECRVRIGDIMTGDLAENIELYGGDVLVIPETRF